MKLIICTTIFFLSFIASSASFFAQSDGTVRLRGQVVCSVCWFEAEDRKKVRYGNMADIDCAIDCSRQNIPQALAVEDENGFTLYTMERGTYRPNSRDFIDLVPRTVEVEGFVRTEKDKKFITVNSVRVLYEKPEKPVFVSNDAVLSLRDLNGAEQSIAALKGRVVVLNFWATWCGPCRQEMLDLAMIQKKYEARGVQVIGAAGDVPGNSAKVSKFIRESRVNFPVWLGATTDDMRRFGVGEVIPATVIIDRQGKIVWREIGVIKRAQLSKALDRLLVP